MKTSYEDIENNFEKDIKNHEITLKHKDGLYQHWRCQVPKESNHWFDIITWPGCLCINGDMGSFLFSRTEDMIHFMKKSALSYSYAAEKCIAQGNEKITKWSVEAFYEFLDGYLEKFPQNKEKIDSIKYEFSQYESEHDATRAMFESGLFDEIPNFECFTYHFVWCLNAINWFCNNYENKPHNKIPGILRTVLFDYKSWLVGSSVPYVLGETKEVPKDFDCIVDPNQWRTVSRILILQDYEINSFGGFKVKTVMGDIDFWPQSLSDFIRHSKCKHFLGFNSCLIAFKESI